MLEKTPIIQSLSWGLACAPHSAVRLWCESGIKSSEERPWGCLVSGHLWLLSPSPSQNNSHAYRVGMRSNTCDSLDPLLEVRKGSWINGELLSRRKKKDDDENKMMMKLLLGFKRFHSEGVPGIRYYFSCKWIKPNCWLDREWHRIIHLHEKTKFKPGESDCAYLSSMKWMRKMTSEPDPW